MMITTTDVRLMCVVLLTVVSSLLWDNSHAQVPDPRLVRYGEAALTFASGAIQKTTPRDGIVNLVTGDNQSAGNRMLLGLRDTLYLKLDHPTNVAVGDLFTVYRRVRKVFHPLTKEYLGLVIIRVAVVKVTDIHPTLTTAETVVSYGPIVPGDLIMRFVAPSAGPVEPKGPSSEVEGMIVEIQADKPMTMISQSNIVYVDRGRADGLQAGDVLDLYRQNAALPLRKIGELRVLATEDHTATARVIKANTRVLKGDRFKRAGTPSSAVPALGVAFSSNPSPEKPLDTEPDTPTEDRPLTNAAPIEFVAKQLAAREASGESRLNLGDLSNVLYYDSGEASIKPEGRSVLDHLIAYLAHSGDRRFLRIEGHTDNVEIGPSLKARYPTNKDLAQARADSVVRYLVEKGGMDPSRLSSVGYGESKPAAPNTTEEGRRKNRRVEIVLYDLPLSDPTANHDRASLPPSSSSVHSGTEHEILHDTTPSPSPHSNTGTFSFSPYDPATMQSSSTTAIAADSLDASPMVSVGNPPSSSVSGTDQDNGASWQTDAPHKASSSHTTDHSSTDN